MKDLLSRSHDSSNKTSLFKRINKPFLVVCAVPLVLGLSACSDDNDLILPTSQVNVFHASPDAPDVQLSIDGNVVGTVDYKQASGLVTLFAGEHDVLVLDNIVGSGGTVIDLSGTNFTANYRYDVLALNNVASLDTMVLVDDSPSVTAGDVKVRVVHAAPAAPEVDVFVTAVGADLTASTPINEIGTDTAFVFDTNIGPLTVAEGTYQIRVTLDDDTSSVVFDSGSVTLAGGSNLVIAAVQNTGSGADDGSPISLAVLDGTSTVGQIYDVGDNADIRVVHGSPDAPAVDVFLNDAASGVANLAFAGVAPAQPTGTSTYVEGLANGSYNVKISATGQPASSAVFDSSTTSTGDPTLAEGSVTSILALGELSDTNGNSADDFDLVYLADDNRSAALNARVRLVHGSVLAGNVDIYVLGSGDPIGNNTPAFSNVPIKASTGYTSLSAGSYDIVVTPTGTGTEALRVTANVVAGGVYTAIVRDSAGPATPFTIIGLDGLAP